jgi:hypothetical protein
MSKLMTSKGEWFIASTLTFLLLLCVNPLEIFGMPSALRYVALGVFTVLFMVFAAFVWREDPQDERESHHVVLAGRLAFLAGAGLLALGIVVQTFTRTLDFWLPAVLGVMILSKTFALAYYRSKC